MYEYIIIVGVSNKYAAVAVAINKNVRLIRLCTYKPMTSIGFTFFNNDGLLMNAFTRCASPYNVKKICMYCI